MYTSEENFRTDYLEYGVSDFELPPSQAYIQVRGMGIPAQEFDGQLPKLYSPFAETRDPRIQDQAVSALHVTQPEATSGKRKGYPALTWTRGQKHVSGKNENCSR